MTRHRFRESKSQHIHVPALPLAYLLVVVMLQVNKSYLAPFHLESFCPLSPVTCLMFLVLGSSAGVPFDYPVLLSHCSLRTLSTSNFSQCPHCAESVLLHICHSSQMGKTLNRLRQPDQIGKFKQQRRNVIYLLPLEAPHSPQQ